MRVECARKIGWRLIAVAGDAFCISQKRLTAKIRGRTDRQASSVRATMAAVLEERNWSYPLIAAALRMSDHGSAIVAARRAKQFDVDRLAAIADAELGEDWWIVPTMRQVRNG